MALFFNLALLELNFQKVNSANTKSLLRYKVPESLKRFGAFFIQRIPVLNCSNGVAYEREDGRSKTQTGSEGFDYHCWLSPSLDKLL
jgi:hypothetical protein